MKALAKWALAGLIAAGTLAPFPVAEAADRPKLVLQITVDQLRGDLIGRNIHAFGDGGFRRLMDNGLVYGNAHHRHANTETVVGHATLATGTDPAVHGMVANLWFDRTTGAPRYNVQDGKYPLLSAGGVDKASEIDPTQRAATTDGRSPRAILSSTISDEMVIGIAGGPKIFGVSVKDRGAITMAGHAGTAYWFSKSEGRFITSSYYMDAYPEWVNTWNDAGNVAAYAETSWTLKDEVASYRFGEADDMLWETDFPGFGRAFPHPYGPADDKYFTTRLTLSPAGDELTASFAKALVEAEEIGADDVTDYLSVSFSSTDYVGHIFGPSSLETEDNLRRLDATLADFLSFMDARVGLENMLIVLSADHGAAEVPAYMRSLGIPARYFSFDEVDKAPAAAALMADFGMAEELIETFSQPYLYLDLERIKGAGLDPDVVARRLAEVLMTMPGIAYAISSADLSAGAVARTPIANAVLANFHAARSGDIYVVFEPHWFIGDLDGLTVAGAHGSPWTYDTHVPIILSGPGIEPARISRRVETVDIAPTIAAYLRIKPPSGSRGEPLAEMPN